jgi:tetratricopeptide (TPR) repeat protein
VHAKFRDSPVALYGPWLRPRTASRRSAVLALVLWAAALVPSPAASQVAGNPAVRRVVTAYHAGRLEEAARLADSVSSSLPAGDAAVLAFYRGLLQFTAGDEDGARATFARAIELDPRLSPDPALHSPSRLRAFEAARESVASQWRAAADRAEADGDLLQAQRHWQNVLLALPEDSAATERLAGVHLALAGGRPADAGAATDTAAVTVDTAAVVVDPATRTAQASDSVAGPETGPPVPAESTELRLYDPGRAALLGVVVPGLGELYAGRPGRGLLVMGAAAGAVAFGTLMEKVDVRCLSVPANGVCPPEDVAGEETTRPYFAPSLGVAAALTLFGAVDAYFAARRANARAAARTRESDAGRSARLERPALVPTSHALRLELLRVRF